jgi:urea transport system substrate-binding protein
MKLKQLLMGVLAVAAVAFAANASAAGVIKVGIMHSLSGTMAISEEPLHDVILMMIKEQNAKGGLLGKKLVPVVVDPASNWPLFAEKAQQLLEKDHVAVVFGCWTSVSRKSVLPVFEKDDGLLFYPVQWEGEESSRNIIYTGATPNQQAIPAVQYLMDQVGVKRWALIGTDYVYPRTTNKILVAYLESKGVKPSDIMVRYTPFGFSDWQPIVSQIKRFGSEGQKTAVVSTINGDANVPFYKELANEHITAEDIPVMAFSVGEQELSGLDTRPLVGHLAAWNYFMSVRTPANRAMIRQWHKYIGNDKRVFNDPMEASVIGFRLWVKAVEKAHTTNVDKIIATLPGLEVPNLSGGMAKVLANHMITKPVLIGEIRPNGQFDIVSRTKGEVPGQAWSKYLPADKNVIADWVHVKCGHYNTVTKVCSGSQK